MAKKEEEVKVGTDQYWEKYAIPRMPISSALRALEQLLVNNIRRGCLCLISEAGEGKSQGVRQVARKCGYRVVDLRTAHFSMMGGGIPQRAESGGEFFKIAVPDYMPKKGEKCILLFDEINQGQSHAISMFFSLLEDRSLYNYELPDDCLVVAAMNPANAGYQVTKLESLRAFNRRMFKIYLYTPFPDWVAHAETAAFHHSDGLEKPCHPSILGYLQTNMAAIYGKVEAEKGQQFPCPATWQTVSRLLYMFEQNKSSLHSEYARQFISASIGTVTAKGLCDFIENRDVRLDPEVVLGKYRPKSEMRTRIMALSTTPGGGVPDLMENMAGYLFTHKPSASGTAPPLALLWADMPAELGMGFYMQLNSAKSVGDETARKLNEEYLRNLTIALMSEKPYQRMNEILNSGHATGKKNLEGGAEETTPDPLDDE